MKHCDPFIDRLCRDIRNDLSEALMGSLRHLDLTPARDIARKYLATDLQLTYRQYINDRMERYGRVLQRISSSRFDDAFSRALVLWDEELFFEVHEILEHAWFQSSGAAKLILQAMIRAAGMYVHLDHGNAKGAASMAAKAVKVLEANRGEVPDILDVDLLLGKLRDVDPVPPKLMGGSKR
jgi:uncharacterized protein